jgi:hypothetical protein
LPFVGRRRGPCTAAKIRQGSTPRVDVDAHVAVERRADVLGPIAVATPTAAASFPRPV